MPTSLSTGSQAAAFKVLKVLIVEDEMFVSWGLEAALAERGHHVCAIAQSAEEALRLAEIHRPDLIFMDIGLLGPGNGLEVAEQILARHPTRIAFSSAWNDPATQAAIERLSAYANIPKPCREADLLAVAERALLEITA
ncbi:MULTISPECIES: response regulator [unclassified Phenylobacterium]|uniref:response regulator n=1 Tax=unclassified Phenylobacterium TaxID=2640670 RepID=UPI00083A7C7F|nr:MULTISPECIES: response regulator [unclassified Phenylobacterium]